MRLNGRFIGVLLGGLLAMGQAPMPGRANASGMVTVRADFSRHTSLHVSTSQLVFRVDRPGGIPRAIVDFTAAARTRRDGEVLLTVEPVGTMQMPEGGVAPNLVVAYEGEGGCLGALSGAGPHVVARWAGSGMRPGRVLFALLGAHRPGVYSLSVKFVLTAP